MEQEKNKSDINGIKIGYWEEDYNYWDVASESDKPAIQRGHYVNGRKNGTWEHVRLDGYVFRKYNIKDGRMYGDYLVLHHEQSIPRITGQYLPGGTRCGDWKHYYKNGTIRQIYSFNNNGDLCASVKRFDTNGHINSEELYVS